MVVSERVTRHHDPCKDMLLCIAHHSRESFTEKVETMDARRTELEAYKGDETDQERKEFANKVKQPEF